MSKNNESEVFFYSSEGMSEVCNSLEGASSHSHVFPEDHKGH